MFDTVIDSSAVIFNALGEFEYVVSCFIKNKVFHNSFCNSW